MNAGSGLRKAKHRMRRATLVLSAVFMASAFAGCAEPPPGMGGTEAAPESTSEQSVEQRVYRACLISDSAPELEAQADQVSDGLATAQRELGIQVDAASADVNELAAAIQGLIDNDCSFVIGAGPTVTDAVSAAARTNETTRFGLIDSAPTQPIANLRPGLINTQETAFLAGYLAASASTSGTVGAFGAVHTPTTTVYLDGFVQGVAHYNDTIDAETDPVEVIGWDDKLQDGAFVNSQSQPLDDPKAGRETAQELVDQGADVLFVVAGASGVGALELASEHEDLRIIWSDVDGCDQNPEYCDQILASVIKDRGVSVVNLIEADMDNPGAPGVWVGDLSNDATYLSPLTSEVPSSVQTELRALTAELISGTIEVWSPSAIA